MLGRAVQSSYRDRTQEFLSAVERLRRSKADAAGSSAVAPAGPRSAVASQSEFNKRASKIGLGIHQTSQKLAKLAKCKTTLRQTPDSAAPPAPWANSSISSELFPRMKSNGDSSSSSQPLLHQQRQQQQQQQQQMVPVQDSYMQSRAEALQNVESTIHELSNIFTQLATMVSEQGEVAIRIDENMEDTLANVEGAQGALLKYLNGISSNRWLMIKIFFVLIVFLMIFLFFVA